jgi:hypothetical protein
MVGCQSSALRAALGFLARSLEVGKGRFVDFARSVEFMGRVNLLVEYDRAVRGARDGQRERSGLSAT